ncbi:MAG TPA: helix-turn-helix domain-containing protein [Longimicrobium sp.]|nr:helix-turn-helix domain-containing protein [Longimicrobium sp.]
MERRTYNEFCGLAKALDVVGERWTLLVVRNLLLGPLRYSELLRGLPGITTNLLAKRLKEMEENGLVERVRAPGEGGSAYRLAPLGEALEPVVHALGRWGWNRMTRPGADEHRSVEWLFVALRRRYRGGASLRAEVVADGVPYRFVLAPERAEIARGGVEGPELRVRAPGMALAALFLHGWPAEGAPEGVAVEGEGGEARLRALVEAFERGDPRVERPGEGGARSPRHAAEAGRSAIEVPPSSEFA